MVRGFSLLELIVALFVAIILMAGAGVSFSPVFEHYQIRKVASELKGFFYQARSEAMIRNRELSIYIKTTDSDRERWELVLYDLSENNTQPLLISSGEGVYFSAIGGEHYNDGRIIRLDRLSGKPMENGHIAFYFPEVPRKELKMIFFSVSGRVRICGSFGAFYGYPAC